MSAVDPDDPGLPPTAAETIERLVLSDAKAWRFLVGIVALVWISRRHVIPVAALSGTLGLALPHILTLIGK